MSELDFDKCYTVPGTWGAGIAWYVLGYEMVRDEDYEWSGIEYANTDRVRAIMVGDDREFTFETTELVPLDDEDYCHVCGQVGCTADGREFA